MAAPQEIMISSCSTDPSSSSSNPNRPSSIPSINVHDLLTSAHLHAFKPSVNSLNSVSYVHLPHGVGGVLFAVQEGKALASVWAWQKVSCQAGARLMGRNNCISNFIFQRS